ncbi:MAG TPA: hypothetical protein PKC47_05910, partial [Petrimonas sp.]|nr:hypothetical protein [Petrimonas sp.]
MNVTLTNLTGTGYKG